MVGTSGARSRPTQEGATPLERGKSPNEVSISPGRSSRNRRRHRKPGVFCFVLFSLQLSVCLWWQDYRRDDFPTLKFVVVIAGLLAIC